MLSSRLIELIETHADGLTQGALKDLATNPRTPSFYLVPPHELQARVFTTYHRLGQWITDPHDDMVRTEYERWGARRFQQGIPLSEIVYAIIILKQHLRRYISDNGLVDAAFPRVDSDYVLPMHLQSLQDLNTQVGQFFDEALYHLARGYENASRRIPSKIAG